LLWEGEVRGGVTAKMTNGAQRRREEPSHGNRMMAMAYS